MRIRGCDEGITNFRDCGFATAMFPFYRAGEWGRRMRHFKTPAGEVHSLRFAPDGESVYFVSKETDDGFAGGGLADMSGLSGLSLYQHAYRIDTRSGEITGDWKIRGSEVAIFAPDFR